MEARKKWPALTQADVEDILQRIPAYTLHKAKRTTFPRLRTVPNGWMTDVQMDLADMQKLAAQNDNMKYILVSIFFGYELDSVFLYHF